MSQGESFRNPAAAGHFYPGQTDILSRRIEEFLQGDPLVPDPGPRGLICPHAGYDFSGPTAGAAYRELKGRSPEVIVIVGPSHYDRFRGATFWPGAGYRTPLGDVRHPEEVVAALEAAGVEIHANRLGHREEHSVEVQIPFIQSLAPGTPVLPLVMADHRRETCEAIGEAIAHAVSGKRALLVASSDLYHGHSNRECRETDDRTISAITRNDPLELARGFDSGKLMACGRAPIMAVLWACRVLGAKRVQLLTSTNSDEVTGQTGGYVVGYAALAIS